MRKAGGDHGFFLCFLLNFILHWEWALLLAVVVVLHFLLHLPAFIIWIVLGLWLLFTLVLTILVSWGSSCGSQPTPEQKNRNPYSVKSRPYGTGNDNNDGGQ